MSEVASKCRGMQAEQVPAAPPMPDQDLAAMRVIPVPDVWPPLDAAPAAGAYPGLTLGQADMRRTGQPDTEPAWPGQFAVLLAETLAGARPVQQVLPWMSERGSTQLRRLLPLFGGGHRPRVLRVLATRPSVDAIEMTLVVAVGPRTRALAVRLERATRTQRPAWRGKPATQWLCTDIEAG